MRRWVAGLAALACVLTACSSTVRGTGHVPGGFPASPGAPGGATPTAPSGTPSGVPAPAPAPATTCPHISYPLAHLRFDCVTSGLTAAASDPVWPLNLQKSVEKTWALSEGAGRWGAAQGKSLQSIAENVRTQMLDAQAYGTSPGVRTTSSAATTVAGVAAWQLQTTFTIDPAFRKAQSLKVRIEKSWILALKVGPDDVSLWYVTLPDDVSNLWATVPHLIDTIKVS